MSTATARGQVQRLLSLLPYLLAHPGASIANVAATFEVTEQQVIDDLNVLWFSGLPGHAMGDYIDVDMEAVEGSGIVVVANADYLSRPLRLVPDEAMALLAALRHLSQLSGALAPEADTILSLIAKIEQAAGRAAEASSAVIVTPEVPRPASGFGDADELFAVTTAIRQSLDDDRRLHLRYWVPGRDEASERDVDPMRLLVLDGRMYLEGWCHRVEDVRRFRLDRILDLTVLDIAREIPAQIEIRDIGSGAFQPSPSDLRVVFELTGAALWVLDVFPHEAVEQVGEEITRVHLPMEDPEWALRLALRLGPSARLVGPPDVVAELDNLLTRALSDADD